MRIVTSTQNGFLRVTERADGSIRVDMFEADEVEQSSDPDRESSVWGTGETLDEAIGHMVRVGATSFGLDSVDYPRSINGEKVNRKNPGPS